MPVPPYYGDVNLVIKVDPDTMYREVAVVMPTYGTQIADSINRIVDVWNGLKLGWVGTTADEAQAFNDAWSAAITKLFGTQDDPTSGILSHIGNAVALASINYGEAESIVTQMFRDMSNALAQAPTGSNPGRNITGGPINENS